MQFPEGLENTPLTSGRFFQILCSSQNVQTLPTNFEPLPTGLGWVSGERGQYQQQLVLHLCWTQYFVCKTYICLIQHH